MAKTEELFTLKQRRVCDLVTLGLSNKEIAHQIGISARTVESHREIIFKKAGVRNAVELARKMLGATVLLGNIHTGKRQIRV